MKRIILTFALALISMTVFCQSFIVLKPVSFQDTTIGKVFCKYSTSYSVENMNMTAVITVYGSKKSYQQMSNSIVVPEIPQSVTIDLSLNQSKTLTQIVQLMKNAIKANLILQNPTWVSSDIIFN